MCVPGQGIRTGNGERTVLICLVFNYKQVVVIPAQLADLYQQSGQSDRIRELIDSAGELRSLDGPVIAEKLKAYLP